MKFLIVGLGNPGIKYENTRHNIGFEVLDKLASLDGASFVSKKHADVSEIKFKGRKLVLVKPTTFMNLSGKAVRYWMTLTKTKVENVLVVTDDISLPLGALRLRKKGSHGGHNGLRDIQIILGSSIYPRLRVGIGNDFSRGLQSEYVLGRFHDSDHAIIHDRVNLAITMIKSFVTIGIDQTMSDYNGKIN